MEREKSRCSKCGAFEVTYVEASANPFGKKKGMFVCQRCGQEYSGDSGINVINRNTINTFPNPNKDLEAYNPVPKKFKPKIDHNTINTFPNPQVDLDVDNPFTSKMKNKFKKEVN